MKRIVILSIVLFFSISFALPNAYAEEESFFDWLKNLFGFLDNDQKKSETAEKQSDVKKAVVIDQLYRDVPNNFYQNKTIDYLTSAGFEVDYYTSENITVDFYKNLPSKNYEFIVFRTHAVAVNNEKHGPSTWIFTGEEYTQKKYIPEQLSGQISMAVPFTVAQAQDLGYETASKDRHFIIGSKLVKDSMVGTFPGSVIILGGCDTMDYTDMGQALLNRGASSVIGWNGLVGAHENDDIVLTVLEEILVNELDVDEAVNSVMVDFESFETPGLKLRHLSSGASSEI